MAQYAGGKNGSGTYQTIINQIPVHSYYFEGFAGSAAIHFNLLASSNAILCDISKDQLASLKRRVRAGVIVKKFDTVLGVHAIVRWLNYLHSKGTHVFAYFDPPYLFEVRKSQKPIYECELSTTDHIAFLSGMISAKFPCMISCYNSSLYSSMLDGWRTIHFQSMTRHGKRVETIYMNYDEPSVLHDYRYIGRNFREREKFSRIRKNMLRKINSLPLHLRNSIVRELS